MAAGTSAIIHHALLVSGNTRSEAKLIILKVSNSLKDVDNKLPGDTCTTMLICHVLFLQWRKKGG